MALEIAGYGVDWRGGIIALVALVLMYMAVVLWRMRRLSELPEADETDDPRIPATAPSAPRPGDNRTPQSGQQQRAAAYAAASRFDDDEPVLTDRTIAEPGHTAFTPPRSEPQLEPRRATPPTPPPVPEAPMPAYSSPPTHNSSYPEARHYAPSGYEDGYGAPHPAEENHWAQSMHAPAVNPGLNAADEERVQLLEHTLMQLRHEVDSLRHELASLRQEVMQSVTQVRATQSASPLYSDAMQMATVGHDAATIAERCGIARAEAELVVALVNTHRH